MKTTIMLLALAVSLLAQVNHAIAEDCDGSIPTPTAFAYQYDGGVLCGTEPITLCEGGPPDLYYFYRDGVMIGFGTEPTFLDYPGYGTFVYQVQISVDRTAGDLSEPVTVEIPGAIEPPPGEEEL
jgi:hypothetical protein